MTKVVYKYTLPLEDGDKHDIKMPIEARILYVGLQGDNICIWALVDPLEEIKEERYFQIVGTGHRADFEHLVYVGTVQITKTPVEFVFHVFERTSH